MARSDPQVAEALRQRLVSVVRPVPRPPEPPPEPPPAPAPAPRRAAPTPAAMRLVDESALRTLIRAPDPSPVAGSAAGGEELSVPDEAERADRAAVSRSPVTWLAEFGRAHLAVVVVLLTLAVFAGGWALLRARDHAVGAEPVVAPSPDRAAGTPGVGRDDATPPPDTRPDGAASPTPAATIMVHVVGAVVDPGVVELPADARVTDAIRAAGGFTETAVPGRLNLAQRLHDGEQVFVSDSADPPSEVVPAGAGPPGPEGGSGGSTAPAGLVNLNTAGQAELETLPGVGPATAQAILAWRREHGRFSRVEELQEVDGIGPKTYARLAPLVTV